jgi:hypothetical protein
MIEEKEEHLDYLENKLLQEQFASNYIWHRKKSILFTALFASLVPPTIIHLSDERRVKFPERYDPMFAISIGFVLFFGFIFLALILHLLFKRDHYFKAKALEKEVIDLDREIYHLKRNFKRFEKFDEIEDKTTN